MAIPNPHWASLWQVVWLRKSSIHEYAPLPRIPRKRFIMVYLYYPPRQPETRPCLHWLHACNQLGFQVKLFRHRLIKSSFLWIKNTFLWIRNNWIPIFGWVPRFIATVWYLSHHRQCRPRRLVVAADGLHVILLLRRTVLARDGLDNWELPKMVTNGFYQKKRTNFMEFSWGCMKNCWTIHRI